MSTIKLLPCPFCGEQPKSFWNGSGQFGDEGYWAIECCHVFCHTDEEDDAARDWNMRAPTDFARDLKLLADDCNSAADRMIKAAEDFLALTQGKS